MRHVSAVCLVALIAGVGPTGAVARAAPDRLTAGKKAVVPAVARIALSRRNIIPVSEVKAGMEGYGLTVFHGTKPERFHVRVIGVLKNFLPKEDVILFRSDDPRLKRSGIVKGMSGSPVYLGGRLAGAVSYGWPYAKDPIGGITPIEYMLEVGERPLRGPNRTAIAQADVAQARRVLAQALGVTPDGREVAPEPPLPAAAGLQRVAVPLMLSGFSSRAVEELRRGLRPFNLEPMQAGGGGGGEPGGTTRFEPGSAIGVTLIRGDMSAVGVGTVTYVEGNRILAFGHPMLGVGEVYLPVCTARVHTFFPSSFSSFKMSSPIAEAGSLIQDRQAAIAADSTRRIEMIPIEVTVGGAGIPQSTMRAEIAKHKFLTPMLAGAVMMSAGAEAAPDIANAVIGIHSTLKVRGYPAVTFHDRVFTRDGLSARVLALSNGFRALSDILLNPFEAAHIEKISFHADISYRADVAEMVALRVDSLEVEPGARINLYVTMRPYSGQDYVETIPFQVPRDHAGHSLHIDVMPGSMARPPVAAPENLGEVIDNLRKAPYSGDSFVITVSSRSDGVAYRGRLMPDLPPSEIDTLRQGTVIRRIDAYRAVTQIVRHAGRVVTGRQAITLKVKDLP